MRARETMLILLVKIDYLENSLDTITVYRIQ